MYLKAHGTQKVKIKVGYNQDNPTQGTYNHNCNLLTKSHDPLSRGLNNQHRVPLRGLSGICSRVLTLLSGIGVLQGVYKGSIVGFYDAGALIIRIGFWGMLYQNYAKEPPHNSIGNYLGPYIRIKDPLISGLVFGITPPTFILPLETPRGLGFRVQGLRVQSFRALKAQSLRCTAQS